jgi:hypothetical protein
MAGVINDLIAKSSPKWGDCGDDPRHDDRARGADKSPCCTREKSAGPDLWATWTRPATYVDQFVHAAPRSDCGRTLKPVFHPTLIVL